MSKLLQGLNPSQQLATTTIEGMVQINATAGSGKTRVLTHRVAYMLEQGIKPSSILLTTFTKKATTEMTERLGSLIKPMQLKMMTIGTSHSIGYRILKKEYEAMGHPLASAFKRKDGVLTNGMLKIFAENIKKEIIYDRTVDFEVRQELKDITIPQLLKTIGLSKNNGIDNEEFELLNAESSARMDAYIEFFNRYEHHKKRDLKIDSDDMLFLLWRLLKENKEVLEKYQRIYKYIMVDESQDNNSIQYDIFSMLAKPHNNLFIVGDDDQCQPGDEQVLTNTGYVPIEKLDPSIHKVVSYDKRASCVKGTRKGGFEFKKASRPYEGTLIRVKAGGNSTRCTPNHKWIIKWDSSAKDKLYCVYMMKQGNKFRIGWCKLFKTDGQFNLGIRAKNQKADSAWVLKVFNAESEASMYESICATQYGLPLIPFEAPFGTKYYTNENLDSMFSGMGDLTSKAELCLQQHDRDMSYPMWTPEIAYARRGGSTINEMRACNLIPDYMTIPVHIKGKQVSWEPISIDYEREYKGEVYSLEVKPHELYITNGLVTHNCMYSFRGANPEEFIFFKNNHPGVTQINLEDNYRSNPGILSVANLLIKNNKKRIVKTLKPHKQSTEECVFYSDYKDEEEEASKVIEDIKILTEQEKIHYKDIAILFRTNAQTRALEDMLIANGLPYVIHGGISFYERKEVKDLVSYLQLAVDTNNDTAFARVINTPSRFLGKAFMEKVKAYQGSYWEAINTLTNWKDYEKTGITKFINLIQEIQGLLKSSSLQDVIDHILLQGGYKEYILGEEEEEESSRLENIETLKFVMAQYENIEDFLHYITLMTSNAKLDIDGIQLMTIHKSKGLEFPVAFVVGVGDGVLPHFKAMETGTVEEERRLCYVAITRAESQVFISSIKSFNGKQCTGNTFIKNMKLIPQNTQETHKMAVSE